MILKLSDPDSREVWDIPILYEDEHLLAFDKPSGLPTSPETSASDRPSLLRLLQAGIAVGKPWAAQRGWNYLMNAHRIDPEASGITVLAKSKPVLAALANLFGSEKPVRQYLALVQGTPAEKRFEVTARIGFHTTDTSRMRIDHRRGKRSVTRCEVVEEFGRWTLLKCDLPTDRPHQLRLHLQYARLRVVADPIYGTGPILLSRLKPGYRLKPTKTERPLISRPAVHCERVSFPHPVTGESTAITAPLPKDFRVALKYLRKFAVGESAHEPV